LLQVIGLLNGQPAAASTRNLAAFRQGLAELGFGEGRNLAIVYRSSEGNVERLPELANEIANIPVAVIAAVGGDESVRSAKSATGVIPIVFTTGGDPINLGLVPSLNRPGGNVTGVTFLASMVATKQIGLLRDVQPKLGTMGLLLDSSNFMSLSIKMEVQAAGQSVGLKLVVGKVSNERDIDKAFTQFVEERIDAVLIGSGILFNAYWERLADLATRHKLPTISANRNFAGAGGLMSYGADPADTYRQAARYVGRILKGEKPADLPVLQPTKFELVVNLKTARTLDITVPPSLLGTADEVIE
jgi:putative tryptophan/tyrosine transport system substrate-binding protein